MSIDEAIEEMRRAAEVNLAMSDDMAEVQDSIFAVEAGVNYQREAERYTQIAEWLEELKGLRSAYRQGYALGCKDSINVYLQENLEGGSENAGKS